MTAVAFVGTNILVHAHERDAGSKREGCLRLLEELWEPGNGELLVQVQRSRGPAVCS
jgi:hypothetical protein